MNEYFYVYILVSDQYPSKHYVGITSDLNARLDKHNAGDCVHTKKYAPWSIETCVRFRDKEKARAFEIYMKSGSGREFARRHF